MIFSTIPRITQYYAENPEYYGQFDLFGHEGLDLNPTGPDKTIFSWMRGTVIRRYDSAVYGKTIIVNEPAKRLSWRVAHMDDVFLKEGDSIQPGDKVGIVGDTPKGRAGIGGEPMPAHLHINCIPMVKGTRSVPNNGFKGRTDPLGVLIDRGEIFIAL